MSDHRILWIRLFVPAVIAAGIACVAPEFGRHLAACVALCPVALFMPVGVLVAGGCGCGSAFDAGGSTTVTVTGVANGSCSDCTGLNQSYVVSFAPGIGGCGPLNGTAPTFCAGSLGGSAIYSLGNFPSGDRQFAIATGFSGAGWIATNPGCSNTMVPNALYSAWSSGFCDGSVSTAIVP